MLRRRKCKTKQRIAKTQVSVLPRTLREQERTEGILVGKLVPGIKNKIVETDSVEIGHGEVRIAATEPGTGERHCFSSSSSVMGGASEAISKRGVYNHHCWG